VGIGRKEERRGGERKGGGENGREVEGGIKEEGNIGMREIIIILVVIVGKVGIVVEGEKGLRKRKLSGDKKMKE
jgi:hypothetical protein